MTERELVFIPQRGFMAAHALGTLTNVIAERNGHTFVGGVAPDRDGIRVAFTVSDIDAEVPAAANACVLPLKATARVVDDRGREVRLRPRWTTGGSLRSAGDRNATLQWTLILESPETDARHLELSFDGPAGDWTVELPLERIDPTGTPAQRIDASDTKQGITLAARAIARSHEMTAIELEAFFDPPPPDSWPRRHVRGIGPSLHGGRLCGDQVVFRDDAGRRHFEIGHPLDEPVGGKRREAVHFPPLDDAVRSGAVEVDVVWVEDGFDDVVTVPVPGEADVTIAGCEGHLVVSRIAADPRSYHWLDGSRPSTAARIEVAPRDPEAARQLVCCTPVESQVGMSISHSVGKLPIVEVPEIGGELREVTIRGATVQIRGPWHLQIPLKTA